MKNVLLACLLVSGLIFSGSPVFAGDFYVIPMEKSCKCNGTLHGTRWCDNGDGTVTDLSTCLVWLQKADWGGKKKWRNTSSYDDAHTRAGLLHTGAADSGLNDGSAVGEWRLPTKEELYGLVSGTEPIRANSMYAFTGVASDYYWSSTTYESSLVQAWQVSLSSGSLSHGDKGGFLYVWPVRGGR